VRASLPLSAAGHAAIIGALLLLPVAMPSRPKVDLTNAVDVVFAPAPMPTPAPAPPQPVVEQPPPPPPPPVVEPPPPPPPQVVEQPPPPPAAQAETPPPPKPAPKPKPRPVQTVERPPEMPLPLPAQTPSPYSPPAPQVASLPPAAAPVVTADYRSMLSSWLESHKHYPEEARQRGEEGRAVLRFRVDRMGRVLNYSVVGSTGFADLDAAVDAMMRGANLPPFPPSMSATEIEVSVTIRFGLAR
jgi:protein TonB